MRISLLLFIFWFIRATFSQYVPFQAASFQSLSRKSGTSPISMSISENDLNDFLVVGYFKLLSTPHFSSIIRISIDEEFINLLHLYVDLSSSQTQAYAKAISNSSLNYQSQMSLNSVSNSNNTWKMYGIGYQSTNNTLFLIHDYLTPTLPDTVKKLQINTCNLSYPLISTPSKLTFCIGCSIMGNVFSQMSGTYSSLRLLNGFSIQGTNILYYNLNGMSYDQLKLSYSNNPSLTTYIETQFPQSDLACSAPDFGFFDGICILLSNCSSLPHSKQDQLSAQSNSYYYDNSISSCNICLGHCSICTSMQYCLTCDDGFELDLSTNTCLKCKANYYFVSSTKKCSSSCPSGFFKDLSNLLCVQSFDPQFHTIGPFLSKSQFFQSSGFQIVITSPSQIIPDRFESCLTNVILHTFYGGANLLSSHSINKSILSIPTSSFSRTISFNAMFTGTVADITLSVNSVVISSLSSQTLVIDVGLCANSNLTYKIVKLTYTLNDISSSHNIKISSSVNGWGIRDFQLQVAKCHPSCTYCFGSEAYQCWACNKRVKKLLQQCFCSVGYYIKYNPTCYQNDCYACNICPSECSTCSDITGKCITCATGYYLKGDTCILPSDCPSNFYLTSSLCALQEQVILTHFLDDKIVQYYDYWGFTDDDKSLSNYSCLNMNWVGLNGNSFIYLQQTFTNYYTFNHSFKLGFNMTNKDSPDQGDDVFQIYSDSRGNNQNDGKTYGVFQGFARVADNGWSNGCGLAEFLEKSTYHEFIIPKSATQTQQLFYLSLQGITNQSFSDEGWLVKDIQLSFIFCDPSCTECKSTSPYNCITCISNASLQVSSPSCSCNHFYYLSISSDNYRGTCKPCNPVCKTCQGQSYLDCIECNQGYLMKLGACVPMCLSGTYWDTTTGSCLQCSSCCLECKGPLETDCYSCSSSVLMTYNQGKCFFIADGSQCVSCSNFQKGSCGGIGTTVNVNYCNQLEWFYVDSLNNCAQCIGYYEACGGHTFENACSDLGYLYDLEENQCFPCSLANLTNCGVEKIQNGCLQNGWVFYQLSTCIKCSSSSQDPACSQCHPSCLTCSGPSQVECLTCHSSFYYFQGYCLSSCPNGYINNALFTCDQCQLLFSPGCQSCFPTCKICSPHAISVESNTCTSCYSSRIFQNGRCNCKDPEDTRVNFYECSYQNQAVLDILLSNNSPTMSIEFGKLLQDLSNYQGQNSNEVCIAIFDKSTLNLLGSEPTCTIFGSKIIVALGANAKIFQGDMLLLLPDVLIYKSETVYIKSFFNSFIVQQLPLNLQIGFSYNKVADSCKDFKIFLKNLSGDCSRGFKTLNWSLVGADSSNLEDVALQSIFVNASANQLTTVIIPKGTVTVEVVKTIKLDLIMKNTYTSSQQFAFQFSKKSISSEVAKSNLTPFYRQKFTLLFEKKGILFFQRFNSLDLSLSWELKFCDANGIPQFFEEDVNIKITSDQMTPLPLALNNFSQKNYIDSIQPYSLSALTTYKFLVTYLLFNHTILNSSFLKFQVIMVSDSNIYTEDSLELFITPSPLVVQITGGSKQIDYRMSQTFQSYFRDRDLQDPLLDQGIIPTWTCVDPVTQTQCISMDGTLVNFKSQPTATVEAGTFAPYTFVVLHLLGTKDTRSSEAKCNLVFSEFDLPNLDITLKMIDPQQQTINLNEEIEVTLEYGENVNTDILSYSGTIAYQLNSVGVIKFDYVTFRFKLWNIFSNFTRSNPYFSLRFSIYNPNFFMPSSTILQYKLNFPPDKCSLSITPSDSNNISLQTTFSLEMKGCVDEDIPIQYQFFYYTNQDEMDEEISNPTNVKRKQIVDISMESEISTILPYGYLILLALAIDNKQAISNSTQSIFVSKQSVTESQYSNLISSYLDSNNKTLATYISQLSIVSQDLSLMSSFNSSDINEQKKKIVSSLQSAVKNLTASSKFEDVTNKAIASLITSGIQYSSTEQSNQLQNMHDTLGQPLPSTFASQKKEQRQQQLYDFYQAVDGMAVNSDLSSNPEISQIQLNLTERISDTLNQNSFPNENQISFSGDSVQIATQKITTKYICAYYRCNATDFQSSQDDSAQPSIYGMSFVQYKEDPFNSDTTFLNYTKQLNNYTNETLTTYPFVLPQIKDINNQSIQIKKEINVEFKQQSNKTSGLACLSKSPLLGWSTDGCKNIYSASYNSFTCICKSANPTTIIDDLESLIINKNLQTAFSAEGFSNISSWTNFYEFVAFWLILSDTIIFLYLQRKGKILDAQDSKKLKVVNPVQVAPINSSNKLIVENLPRGPTRLRRFDKHSAIQIEEEDQKKDDQQLVIEDIDNELCTKNTHLASLDQSKDIKPKNSPLRLTSIRCDGINQETDIKRFDTYSIDTKNTITPSKFNSQPGSITIVLSKQQNQLDVKQEKSGFKRSRQYIFKLEEKDLNLFSQVQWIKQILFFHNFFNIFLIYDPKLSRQLRFAMFYVRLVHSLAVSIVYDSQYTQLQMIAVSIVNAIIVTIALKLLEFLTNFRSFGKKLASIFLAALLLFYYYLILSIVSGQKSNESNKALTSFIIVFFSDLFVIATLTAICMQFLAKHVLKRIGNMKFSKQIIEFLKLQMILKIISKL